MPQFDPSFEATRAAGLARLEAFVAKAGQAYTSERNYDFGPGAHRSVSQLSPYVRARLITEEDVLSTVLRRVSFSNSEKFVQEVFWRTYFKGWLEQRPSVWDQYQAGVVRALDDVATRAGLRRAWEEACNGDTGIACFDAWAQELTRTGYLHNHARMWFASIWIFTLRLPWELGADFFLRHLLDGDPASNTLSWRWVAGLHTKGKHYLARAWNIKRYTNGRFDPEGALNESAGPLTGPPLPERGPIPADEPVDTGVSTAVILHDEDMSPAFAFGSGAPPIAAARLNTRAALTPLKIAPHVIDFADDCLSDCAAQFAEKLGNVTRCQTAQDLADWAKTTRAEAVVTPYAPVGPTASTLRDLRALLAAQGQTLHLRQRAYDTAAWPHATAGFFKFKEKIPSLLASQNLLA